MSANVSAYFSNIGIRHGHHAVAGVSTSGSSTCLVFQLSGQGVECRYPQRRGQKSASPIDPAPDSQRSNTAHNSGSSSAQTTSRLASTELTTTRAIHFLAPDLFHDLRLQVPRMDWDIPAEIEMQLGGRQQMQETTKEFLSLTRSWMPVVNGKRHLAAVLNPLVPLRRPTALLALCMKLCSLPIDDVDGKRVLYELVKQFYAEVEGVEEPCVQIMQSAVFIAVFEIGDAIHPAAYLTVGALARYGMSIGLDKINQKPLGEDCAAAVGASWMDVEEMRRVWWGTLILDRGILLLQQHYWQQMNLEAEHGSTYNIFPETQYALETLVRISTTLCEGGYSLWQYLEDGRCSLFLVELVYQGMLVLLRMGKGRPDIQVQEKKESLSWLLSHMGKRWPLVAVYKRILEARESILAVENALM
ncbi:Zn(II)Cys6 transcriptional activator [Fusarium beomiforme]|uniref:Zn(II)Cys6 transcriptional activator n=1 Tax=Fusarium beomiforme TaxID=44412 RepID=A0A9P5ABW8_9HYPO|nr:Zn(II)Cys6 transcriptional activator [Fusarium beomiforme]